MDEVHKYYCEDCRVFLFGASPARLAIILNDHNKNHHPSYSDMWTGVNIVRSKHYTCPLSEPEPVSHALVEYTIPSGMREWGTAKNAPVITQQDRDFLAEGRVKW